MTDLDKLRHYLDERLDFARGQLARVAKEMVKLGHEHEIFETAITELEAIAELVTPSDSEVV